MVEVGLPFCACCRVAALHLFDKGLQRNPAVIGEHALRAIGIGTADLAAIALASAGNEDHMSELSGLLVPAAEQLSIDAEGSAEGMIQRQIDRILIFLGILRQHRRIGVVLEIYRYFQCLFEEAETVILDLQSMGFHHDPVLLIDDAGDGDTDTQQLLFSTGIPQELRYLFFHFHAIGEIGGELQAHPLALLDLGA